MCNTQTGKEDFMDSAEVRKLRCVEKIRKVLEEEKCILQTKITIVGKMIVNDEVIVMPIDMKDVKVENPEKGDS